MYALRATERFGPRILPIIRALKDTLPFLLVVSFTIAAFTHAYFVLVIEEGAQLVDVFTSFMLVFRLGILNDFDMGELEGSSPALSARLGHGSAFGVSFFESWDGASLRLVQLWFLCASLILTVMMMNILIGILGSNYERYDCLLYTSDAADE